MRRVFLLAFVWSWSFYMRRHLVAIPPIVAATGQLLPGAVPPLVALFVLGTSPTAS